MLIVGNLYATRINRFHCCKSMASQPCLHSRLFLMNLRIHLLFFRLTSSGFAHIFLHPWYKARHRKAQSVPWVSLLLTGSLRFKQLNKFIFWWSCNLLVNYIDICKYVNRGAKQWMSHIKGICFKGLEKKTWDGKVCSLRLMKLGLNYCVKFVFPQ